MTGSKHLLLAPLVAVMLTLLVYASTGNVLAFALFPMLLSLGIGIVELASDLSRGKFDTFGFHIPVHVVFWLLLLGSLAGMFWSRNGS